MTTPTADLANLNNDSPFVELFRVDLTPLGGSVYLFTNFANPDGTPLSFNGQTYQFLPIQAEGWDFTSTGTPPKPMLTVSNVSKTLLYDVISLGDLVGGTVTRIRTFAKYLDNGSSPDGSRFLGPETYIIEQKTGHNEQFIAFQLTSIFDRLGMRLPRRQVLRDKGFPGVSRTRVSS